MSTPFQVFPWNRPFLPALKDFMDKVSGGRPGKALIITPHLRPARYMTNLYRKDKRSSILPKMLSINELVSKWRSSLSDEPLHMANSLDQVSILHECVKELDLSNAWAASLAANMEDMESFLPWGLRLAKILEDFAIEGVRIRDFANMEDELGNTPAAILSSLREIGDLWETKLKERNWTTPGQDHKFVAANADKIPEMFMPGPERPVIIAGFYILTGTHNTLLESLWKAGAHVCLHTDPALLEGREHWAASRHGKWVHKWKAPLELALDGEWKESEEQKTRFTFFAGYDLHSQLAEVDSLLSEQGKDGLSTAIIPCQEEALTPLLQNLPPVNVNVSMGYPMDRSPLTGLFQNILQMFANSPREGCWRSADVLAVIRHPYVHMLKEGKGEESSSYNSSLYKLERELLRSGLFWELEKNDSLAKNFIMYLKDSFGGIDSLERLGQAIEDFCRWLLGKGKDGWRWKNPLDMEVMHRLVHNVVPVLRNSLLCNEKFSKRMLLNFFNGLIGEERIPFQAEPIEGLQVLGMLESRLLQFDRLLFLDATDEALPASGGQDPLLPDTLRTLAGLPDRRDREATAAHNLFRLLAGAREAHFLWQEGVPAGEFYDSKRKRSRFVERLIWEEEQKDPNLLDERAGLVRRPMSRLNVMAGAVQALRRSSQFDAALDRFWSGSVSVTELDSYLKSPFEFIMGNVMKLGSGYSVPGRQGMAGTFVHNILKEMHLEQNNGQLIEILDKDERSRLIADSYEKVARKMRINQIASLEDQMALNFTVPMMLEGYFSRGTDRIGFLGAEEELEGEVDLGSRKIKFSGRMDRLDLGSDGLYVIDYKTGKTQIKNTPAFWDNADFFANVEKACVARDIDALDESLAIMRDKVGSLQLPLYLLLLAGKPEDKYGAFPANAMWAYLRHAEKELPLLSSPLVGKDDPRLGHFVQAIKLIYHHALLMPEFLPDQ